MYVVGPFVGTQEAGATFWRPPAGHVGAALDLSPQASARIWDPTLEYQPIGLFNMPSDWRCPATIERGLISIPASRTPTSTSSFCAAANERWGSPCESGSGGPCATGLHPTTAKGSRSKPFCLRSRRRGRFLSASSGYRGQSIEGTGIGLASSGCTNSIW